MWEQFKQKRLEAEYRRKLLESIKAKSNIHEVWKKPEVKLK